MYFFIITCLFATVLAAPQGYNYNQQQFDIPAGLTNFNANSQTAATLKTQEGHGFLQHALNSGNLERVLPGGQSTTLNTQAFSTAPNLSKFQPTAQQNFGLIGAQQQQQAPMVTNSEGQQQQPFNGFQQQQQQPFPSSGLVTKDIYVHVPPEDIQNQQNQQSALPGPPRKHYRIVFIKAPTHNTNNAALRIQQAPAEEKTIIYVLTKKADPLDLQAALQEVQPKQPSKPEVYFIKYKTQEEATHAQRAIQAQYEQLGGTSQISDEGIAPVTSVVGSLNGSQRQQQPSLNIFNGSGHSSSTSTTSSSSSVFNPNRTINNNNKYLPPTTKL